MTYRIVNAHAEDALPSIHDGSIDALVTDPPAGISFMGREWDSDKGGRDQWIAWLAGILRECYRAMKPGAHGLVWALPRTSHWTATACEDAGFEVRDVVMHIQGQGFPKSLDVGKAIAKKGHAEERHGVDWSGWGTALKPAAEHWILIRKPLVGTVAENVLAYGTGGLNIDGCRIGMSKCVPSSAAKDRIGQVAKGDERGRTTDTPGFDPNVGRFPAHIVLDEEAAAMLDEQSGTCRSSGIFNAKDSGKGRGDRVTNFGGKGVPATMYADHGGASRFFYVAKGSTSEKSAGIDGRNPHPTVKSIALMRWLVRLITPPGGTVLDVFAGTGSTLIAATLEGFHAVGIEQSEEYAQIAEKRLAHWTKQPAIPGTEAA